MYGSCLSFATTLSREAFARDIAPARTFGFVHELDYLKSIDRGHGRPPFHGAAPPRPDRRHRVLRLRRAELVALRELQLQRLHLVLESDLRRVVRVPGPRVVDRDREIRRHARPEQGAPVNFIEAVATAIENRVEALASDAENLLDKGESEYAKLKALFASEMALLAEEIRSIASKL